MSKSNSLENINLQFRTIMGKMGLDEEKQNKLSHKLDLSKKIKTIISMQTLEERKKKICEYLERIRENFSLMSFLSLHCSLENGNKTLFSIFMNCKGEEIILKSIKEMEGDSISIILEFVFMLLEKYQWEVPSLLEIILKRYLEIKFKTNTFYKIIEYYIKKGDYEVIFKNTTPFGCVCNSYLSKIMCDNNNDGKVDGMVVGGNEGKVGGSSKDNEGCTTKGINEKQSISFSFLLDLLKKGNLKLEYVNYIENIFLNKPNTIIKKKCKSERLYEIIRIAEEKNLLELVTCVIESVVIGGKEYVTVLSKDKGVKGDKEKGEGDIKDISKEEGVKGGIKDLTLTKPNNDTPIHQPNLINTINQPTSNTTQPNTNTTQNTTHNKKKIIKKIVKKSTPLFSYEQLKWTKINKKGTIFEKVTKIEFKDKDLEPFIKKEVIKKDNPFLNLNKKTTIFPDKKNYALNIALSRIKLSDKELKDKILNLSQDLNMNLIKQLLLYFPTEEEKGVLKGRVDRKVDCSKVDIKNGVKGPFSNTPSLSPTLSTPVSPTSPPSLPTPTSHNRAESFFIECIPQIDLFKESLLLLNLKSLLDSLPISHLDTLSFYYQTILSSIPLKDLLGTLLSLGNSLNKGTPLGQAEGFTFDSILNLITPKTKDILRSYCNLNLFKKEFKILYEVQKISLESFKMDFKEVNEIKKEINIKDLNLKDKYKKIENKYKETNEFYEKACEYLNEKINEEFNMKFLEIYLSVVE